MPPSTMCDPSRRCPRAPAVELVADPNPDTCALDIFGLPAHNIGLIAHSAAYPNKVSIYEILARPSTLPTAPAVVREQPGGETMRAIILTGFGGLDR